MYRVVFFFQAEDGIRDLVRSRGLGDVYKRQTYELFAVVPVVICCDASTSRSLTKDLFKGVFVKSCLLYTSDAADERSSVDLGGRRIIKKKTSRDVASVGTIKTKDM